MSLTLRRLFVLFFLFLLIVKQCWKILLLLLMVFAFSRLEDLGSKEEKEQTPFKVKVREYVEYLGKEDEKQYYLDRLDALERLEPFTTPQKLAELKLRMINQLLYQIPLTDDAEDDWVTVRQDLLLQAAVRKREL